MRMGLAYRNPTYRSLGIVGLLYLATLNRLTQPTWLRQAQHERLQSMVISFVYGVTNVVKNAVVPKSLTRTTHRINIITNRNKKITNSGS